MYNTMNNDVYVVSACRTGIGSFNGQFRNVPASLLGTIAVKFCMRRIRLSPMNISEVILGQVLTAGCGPNPAHLTAIKADIPPHIPAITVNMLSGSGLKAVHMAYQAIHNGDVKFVVCGGQENMTMAEHVAYLREGIVDDVFKVEDTLLVDGLNGGQMGQIAEDLARSCGIPRLVQDEFALNSHVKASKAVNENYFIHEIVPVVDIVKDESVKLNATLETFFQMPTIFEEDLNKHPSITDGNSSKGGDGAAVLILCNEQEVVNRDLIPLVKIIAFAQTGVNPVDVTHALIRAIEKVLKIANWNEEDVDLYEINKAFAIDALTAIAALKLDPKKVNVTGGAIAIGDPLGASGARMLVTLIYNLHRLKVSKGVAAISIGGGMGIAIAVEKPVKNLVI